MTNLTFEKFWSSARQKSFNKDSLERDKKISKEELYIYKSIARVTWEVAWLTGKNAGYDIGHKDGMLKVLSKQGLLKSRIQWFFIRMGQFFRRH